MDEAEELVVSESTKKKRKIAERKEKVDEAAMTRLPFVLSEKGPLYKGVMVAPKDTPDKSTQWGVKKGSLPKYPRTKHLLITRAIVHLRIFKIIRSVPYSHCKSTLRTAIKEIGRRTPLQVHCEPTMVSIHLARPKW